MKRPRLTKRVMSGLSTMASVAEAGAPSDFLGTAPVNDDTRNPAWDEVVAACEWITGMSVWRQDRRPAKGQFLGTYKCDLCPRRVRVYDWLPGSVQCAKCKRETLAAEKRSQGEHEYH